jgi:hypothetical protein
MEICAIFAVVHGGLVFLRQPLPERNETTRFMPRPQLIGAAPSSGKPIFKPPRGISLEAA